MTSHLTEEELILHFYGERRSEEAAVDAHLSACGDCRTAWRALREAMQMVDDAAVPEPAAGFERRMWARVQQALPEQAVPGRPVRWFGNLGSLASLAAAAAVVLAVALGGHALWTKQAPPSRPVAGETARATAVGATGAADRERVLLTALNGHFQQSELLLVELMNAPETGGDLAFERRTADDLLDSSRLYRASAQQNGNPRLAAMLQDLESVLVEIARSPTPVNRNDFNSLRARIDSDSLLFKVRAVSKQIQDRQRALSTE